MKHPFRPPWLPALVLACIVFGTVPSGVRAAEDAQPDQPMIGEPAPRFELATTDGDTLTLSVFKGKILVVHFGASW